MAGGVSFIGRLAGRGRLSRFSTVVFCGTVLIVWTSGSEAVLTSQRSRLEDFGATGGASACFLLAAALPPGGEVACWAQAGNVKIPAATPTRLVNNGREAMCRMI